MEREALTIESLSLATAAHNSGGLVIAEAIASLRRGTPNPRQVQSPGTLAVDRSA